VNHTGDRAGRSLATKSRDLPAVETRPLLVHLLRSLRPRQWSKNLIVFFGLVFSEQLLDPVAGAKAALAFAVFCALSGVVYLVNDIRDREADRMHPVKARRPIASGALAPQAAATAAAVIGAAALAAAFALTPAFGGVAVAYLLLLTVYSIWLKHMVILDVLAIAAGFVLRAYAGAVAISVEFSHWLLLLTLLSALFLALSKRRAELISLADDAAGHRRSLAEYSPYLLDQMIGVVTACTLLAYAFYTIDDETVLKFGTDRLLWTVPFPLYGIFRYLYLVHQREGGGDPSETLLTDRPIQVCVALWGAAVLLILYGPWR
jgi:4-hydroxybenzoate polyprenyltransferase